MAEKQRGRFLFVSANVVNHPLLSHLHARLGAVLPFKAPPAGGDDAKAPWALEERLPPAANVLDATAAADSRCMQFQSHCHTNNSVYHHVLCMYLAAVSSSRQ